MVKMFVYKYTGATNETFINGELYIGRMNKAGAKMAVNDKGQWVYVDSRRLTICRLKKDMEIVDTFTVPNHKVAVNLRWRV